MPTIPTFEETRNGSQVSFGRAWTDAMLEHVRRLGLRRVAVLCTAGRTEVAERAISLLADRGAGTLPIAVAGTPKSSVEAATTALDDMGADGFITIGGGSATALGKATQLSRSRSFIAVPTTYCGAEMTETYGISDGCDVVHGREERVRPTVVIYDPVLTLSLPRAITAASLFGALSLAVDALYSSSTSARLQAMASSAITRIAVNLARACEEPENLEVRAAVMRGSYQAATVHGSAGMAMGQHMLSLLVSELGLPYAQAHCVLLPHVVAFNAGIATRASQAIGRALGSRDPAAALFDLALIVDAPTRLDRLGIDPSDVKEIAAKLSLVRFDNPRRASANELEALLHDARLGRRPSVDADRWPTLAPAEGPHGALMPGLGGRGFDRARRVVVLVHGQGHTAERMLTTGARLFDSLQGSAFVAIQAEGRSWFPYRFDAPIRDNAEAIASCFAQLDAAMARLEAMGFRHDKIVLYGEHQGACVVLDYAARRGGNFAGVIGFAGALLGPLRSAVHHEGDLHGVPMILGGQEEDPWVPKSRIQATAEVLTSMRAKPKVLWHAAARPETDSEIVNAIREMFGKGPRERERDRDRGRS